MLSTVALPHAPGSAKEVRPTVFRVKTSLQIENKSGHIEFQKQCHDLVLKLCIQEVMTQLQILKEMPLLHQGQEYSLGSSLGQR